MRVAVCGTVGSGKSSLLSCILGEIHKLSGTVRIRGSKAYVAQSPWILTGSIRDNILFGKAYDGDRYWRTVEACALVKDFELFSCGDLTEIGERGINMSGGQKQRIQIARAIYQDADIYLLDDPFSAVDAHTGTHLFQECLMGILESKTVIYVTHQVEFLPAADLIVVMRNGRIVQTGKFDQLVRQNDRIRQQRFNLWSRRKKKKKEKPEEESAGNKAAQSGKLVQDEEREKGSIGKQVYWEYLTCYKGGVLVPIIVLVESLFQGLQIASNYWIAWATPSDAAASSFGMGSVLFVYAMLAASGAICVLLRAVLVATVGLSTAEKLFSSMLKSVVGAPMHFFDSTPTGRILNRASRDQNALDLEMGQKLGSCAFSIIQMLGTIVVMSQVAWEVFVIFIPVTAICIWYQVSNQANFFLATARELARLTGIQSAPILHHFSESLAGAATIRAFDQGERFIALNLGLINNHSRPWFHNMSAVRYAEHLPWVLKNVSCTFPGRRKVGVVGRTGSGKSTLTQALFRMVQVRAGSIIIDGIDISKIGLHDLRSRLSIIPQDPTMFQGTVRGNLDPLGHYSDLQIWEVCIGEMPAWELGEGESREAGCDRDGERRELECGATTVVLPGESSVEEEQHSCAGRSNSVCRFSDGQRLAEDHRRRVRGSDGGDNSSHNSNSYR
ncbi:Putative ABC transporter C family member 15 [Linum grandiflorum]